MLICPNCGEGESILFHNECEDSLPDGFYCEYCYYPMGKFKPNKTTGEMEGEQVNLISRKKINLKQTLRSE